MYYVFFQHTYTFCIEQIFKILKIFQESVFTQPSFTEPQSSVTKPPFTEPQSSVTQSPFTEPQSFVTQLPFTPFSSNVITPLSIGPVTQDVHQQSQSRLPKFLDADRSTTEYSFSASVDFSKLSIQHSPQIADPNSLQNPENLVPLIVGIVVVGLIAIAALVVTILVISFL